MMAAAAVDITAAQEIGTISQPRRTRAEDYDVLTEWMVICDTRVLTVMWLESTRSEW